MQEAYSKHIAPSTVIVIVNGRRNLKDAVHGRGALLCDAVGPAKSILVASSNLVCYLVNVKPKEVGVFDAKTHLSELLEDVERGQVIYLTRRGRRIAELRPIVPVKSPLVRGSAKNERFRMAADFDASLPDFADYE